MKYAQDNTVEFLDGDGDALVLRAEPTGSQYDERQAFLGTMRIPGDLISNNTNMEDLFAGGEMVEINADKKALAEYQFKALFVSMTLGGRTFRNAGEAMGAYRKLDKVSKDWIDAKTDEVWRKHEEAAEALERAEGESEGSSEKSSRADLSVVDS
jgi:hypothetical protein